MRRVLTSGALWGAFCAVGNGWPVVSTIVQMAVPWVLVAATVGWWLAGTRRHAAMLGALALVSANLSYFVVGAISSGFVDGSLPTLRFLLLWGALGIIVGPIAGVLGFDVRTRESVPAVTALAVISVAEPLALWAHIDHLDAHFAYVVVALFGLALPMWSLRRDRRRAFKALLAILALTYPAAVVLEATLIALSQVSPPIRLIP